VIAPWNDTVKEHRRAVRDALLDAAAALVAQGGPSAVNMSAVAERAGIGRATLYKYFPDLEALLLALHERHVSSHLAQLTASVDGVDDPAEQLAQVLHVYAAIAQRSHDSETVARLHRGEHMVPAWEHLESFVADILARAVAAGQVRPDVPVRELARYCLRALDAARDLESEAALSRLVSVTLAGLRR
jgi:AcrR family transcriptional regulator